MRKEILNLKTTFDPRVLKFFKTTIPDPTFKLYLQRMDMPAKRKMADYLNFKTAFSEALPEIPQQYRYDLFSAALNDLVNLCHKGNVAAYTELMQLYEWGGAHGLVVQDGQLSKNRFATFVQIASLQGDKKYIRKITSEYLPLLAPAFQADAQQWVAAQLLLYKGKPQACLDSRPHLNIKDETFLILSKTTFIKAFVDLLMQTDETPVSFYAFCNAFEQFIRRHKSFSDRKKESYRRFAQYARRLVKFKEDGKGGSNISFLKKMKKAIDRERYMVGKPWLYGAFGKYLSVKK